MEKTGFTPGPWLANFSRYGGQVIGFHITENEHGSTIPVCDSGPARADASPNKIEGDARLIAAAPCLYAALKEARERIALTIGDYNGILGRIEVALSKVEG